MRVLMWPTALVIAVGVPAANAQVQSPSPALSDHSPDLSDLNLDAVPRLTEQSPPNISGQKLDAVATAIERVASLKQDYRQRIAAAAPSDKESIAFEAINALANAVTNQGLSLNEYDSILEVAQAAKSGSPMTKRGSSAGTCRLPRFLVRRALRSLRARPRSGRTTSLRAIRPE